MLALSYRPPRMDEGTETTSGTWRHWSLAKLDGTHHRQLSVRVIPSTRAAWPHCSHSEPTSAYRVEPSGIRLTKLPFSVAVPSSPVQKMAQPDRSALGVKGPAT